MLKPTTKKTTPTTPPVEPQSTMTKADVQNNETADSVIKRIVGADGRVKKGKLHELPLVSAVFRDTEDMNTAINRLTYAHQLREEIRIREEGVTDVEGNHTPGLKDIKEELTAICIGAEVPGFRLRNQAVLVLTQTRTNFRKEVMIEKLVEAGVDVDVIAEAVRAATKEGDPFYVVKLEEVS